MSRTWKDGREIDTHAGRVVKRIVRAQFKERYERFQNAPPPLTPGQVLDAALKKLLVAAPGAAPATAPAVVAAVPAAVVAPAPVAVWAELISAPAAPVVPVAVVVEPVEAGVR